MTPKQQALRWAIEDVEELGYDPMTHLHLTKALARLYLGLIGDENAPNHVHTHPKSAPHHT